MKHQYLEFKVIHQKIQRTDSFFVVGGSVNYLKARFTFCEDWDGKEQIAIFTGGGKSYAVSLKDGECFVPWEVLRVKRFYVGCMAGERITSNAVAVDVCPCGVGDDLEEYLEPTPTVFDEKIQKYVAQYLMEHPVDGSNIYIQTVEPKDAPDGSIWINPEEEPPEEDDSVSYDDMAAFVAKAISNSGHVAANEMASFVAKKIAESGHINADALNGYATTEEMKSHVERSIQELIASIEIAEEGAY